MGAAGVGRGWGRGEGGREVQALSTRVRPLCDSNMWAAPGRAISLGGRSRLLHSNKEGEATALSEEDKDAQRKAWREGVQKVMQRHAVLVEWPAVMVVPPDTGRAHTSPRPCEDACLVRARGTSGGISASAK